MSCVVRTTVAVCSRTDSGINSALRKKAEMAHLLYGVRPTRVQKRLCNLRDKSCAIGGKRRNFFTLYSPLADHPAAVLFCTTAVFNSEL